MNNTNDKPLIRMAFACPDGKSMINSHFGDSTAFTICEGDGHRFSIIKMIPNGNKFALHGEKEKAINIIDALKSENIQIVVARNYGPNIEHIITRLVPVKTHSNDLKSAIRDVAAVWNELSVVALSEFSIRGRISFDAGKSSETIEVEITGD
ncbi:NifB/NifX family molybdenum-iron cluster-binding protein [Myxococcota bacterium]|nr:NifB/NifX family molybdenum-iron cluster-binding protein [Myxococcota bacterium]MBU1379687.1 NifB/NifX family molybdenum-iron cluster-binding protein [Myxococcota bacterium]MBU1496898.1 NifB/NifX family molybdenum-iron cluster-binding protein [Myxococcota bacterium]